MTAPVMDCGPADAVVDAPAPSTVADTATPVSPAGIAVPGVRPAFTVAVDNDTPGQQVQIQWSADPTFATGTGTATGDAPAGLIDAQTTIQPGADLSPGVLYWRARIVGTYGAGPWSSSAQFAINTLEGQALAAGSWTVRGNGQPVAHLWFLGTDGALDAGDTFTITGTGFGATPAVKLGATACPVTAVDTIAASDDDGTATRVITPGETVDPYHQVITAVVPAIDPAEHQGDAVTVSAISNGVYLPLLPSPPLPAQGWTVKVYALRDVYAYALGRPVTPLAQISRYQAMTWSGAVSESGVGSITLSQYDPLFSYSLPDGRTPDMLWRDDNLWVVFYNGQWRGEFWGEKVDLPRTSSAEASARTVTISGPGAAQCLKWAKVFSVYYPNPTPAGKIGVYQYTNQPVMSSWLQLLAASQKLGLIPYVQAKFSAGKDTAGKTWEDTPAPKPKNTATTTVGDVNFANNSTALTAAGQAACAAIAKKLAKVTSPVITITGHTDSNGTLAHNYQQGLDRANTVANAILAIAPLAQVTTASKGETQPIASNATAAGRAKNRRVVVTYQSAAAAVDTIYTPERGASLLDLLTQLTSGQVMAENRGPIHAEWIMQARFRLQVTQGYLGVDRSKTAVFHEGSTFVAAETQSFDRTDIANVIAVQNDSFAYKTATNAASVKHWGKRQMYTFLEGSYAPNIHALIASTQALAYGDEVQSSTIQITTGIGRTPYADFGLGDTIGLWRTRGKLVGGIEKQRVMAITATVDSDGNTTWELTLNATRQARVSWLQLQVDSLINRKRGIRAFIQDTEPTGALPGDFYTPTISANV